MLLFLSFLFPYVGYIVILNQIPDVNDCAHEASHIVTHLEQYFGLESYAHEYRAYITGWFAEKINDVYNEKENSNDGKENESQSVAE